MMKIDLLQILKHTVNVKTVGMQYRKRNMNLAKNAMKH